MADEHEEECLPPVEFILSTIHQGENNQREVTFAKNVQSGCAGDFVVESNDQKSVTCQCCLRNVNELLCNRCVMVKDTFSNKQQEFKALRNQRKLLLDTYMQRWKFDDDSSPCEQYSACLQTKMELDYSLDRLRTFMHLKRSLINRNLERLTRLQSERRMRAKIADKLSSTIDFLTKKSNAASKIITSSAVQRRQRDLAKVRQRFVSDLLSNVFSLDAVSTSSSITTHGAMTAGTISLDDFVTDIDVQDVLTDATLTMFLHGRWIFMGNSPDVQYRLVRSCLVPDHSDYGALKGWLFKDAVSAATAIGSGGSSSNDMVVYNPPMTTSDNLIFNRSALGTLSALAYCAQLVNVMARILDIRLPFSLTFSDFFVDQLKESELDTAIVKLNANVAYLCSTQRMDYECVCFERPFWSLCNLSKNIKDLGYQSHFLIDARVARGFVNAEKRITWMERAQVTTVESVDDWETVNDQIPEWTGAASSPPTLSQLWTSATTSVANLFKMHN